MTKLIAVLALVSLGCDSPTVATDTWSEALAGHPDLTLIHEHDATGEWVTVVDARHTELCMFPIETGDALDAVHIATICEWPTVDAPVR